MSCPYRLNKGLGIILSELKKTSTGTLASAAPPLNSIKTIAPSVIDLLSATAVVAFEGVILGRFSSVALAGGGMAFTVLLFLFTIFITFVVGAAVPISRHLGAGERDKADQLFGNTLGITGGIGIIFAIASLLFCGVIFRSFFGVSGEVDRAAVGYFKVLAFFMPIIALNFTGTGILRATGDGLAAMAANLTANLTQAFGAILLVYGDESLGIPSFGVPGAALALGIGQSVGLAVQFRFILGNKTQIRPYITDIFNTKLEQLKRILKTGIPATLDLFIWMAGQVILLAYIARIGESELAAHQIILRLTQTFGVIYQGYAFGNMALCGHFLGAGELQYAAKISQKIRYLSLFTGIILGSIIYLFSEGIVGMFTNDPLVAAAALILMPILALQQIPKSLTMITASELRARGDLIFILLVGGIFVALNEVALAAGAVFLLKWGLPAIWTLMVLDEIDRLIAHLLRIRKGVVKTV